MVYLQSTILKVIFLANMMIHVTNTAKNLTLKNKHVPRMVIPIIYKLSFSVKINMEKKPQLTS